jgi:hypothetical protein
MTETLHQPWLIVRIAIDGHTRVVEHIDKDDDVEAMAERYLDFCDRAAEEGHDWSMEIVDPDGEVPPRVMANDPRNLLDLFDSPESLRQWLDDFA